MKPAVAIQEDDVDGWAERGAYWMRELETRSARHDKRLKFLHEPLILSGHGVRLRIDRGTLLVKNGFTHYPQLAEEHRFFPRDRRLPSRIVIIDGDGSLTLDALEWLAEQGVPLVQINWRGEVVSVGGGVGYAADLDILRAQLEVQGSPFALSFACGIIADKIANSIDTVKQVLERSSEVEQAVQKLQETLHSIRKNPPSSVSNLLGAEGLAAVTYFRCWRAHPLRWKGLGKKPIPENWHRIGSRMTDQKGNQFATHPVNAMLNYAYGMLENQVRSTILAAGFDPTIGTMHAYEPNRPSLVFDLMEPLRPLIDLKILEFVNSHTFSPSDFVISTAGVCKLHPQFARVVVGMAQDVNGVENTTIINLKRLLFPHPATAKKAGKNIGLFKARLVGRRE